MPKLKMCQLQQVFHRNRLEPAEIREPSAEWPLNLKDTRFTWHGRTAGHGALVGKRSRNNVHPVPIMQRNGLRFTVHRFMFFNTWDDRDQFNYEQYREQEATAKQIAVECMERLYGKDSRKVTLLEKYNPNLDHAWRTTVSGSSHSFIPRPMWLCVHARELSTILPRVKNNDFSLTPRSNGFQPFAAIPNPVVSKGDPALTVKYMLKFALSRKWAAVKWNPTIPMEHGTVVGQDRRLMMSMFATGMTTDQVLDELPRHPEYQGIEISEDYRMNQATIESELFGK